MKNNNNNIICYQNIVKLSKKLNIIKNNNYTQKELNLIIEESIDKIIKSNTY